MFRKLIPQELGFFDLFERHIDKTLDGAMTFKAMLGELPSIAGKVHRIEEIEHECDNIVHLTIDLLHKTFLTPIDRSDIHGLITNLDNIVDYIHATAQRMTLFEITEVFDEFVRMFDVLTHSIEELKKAISHLRNVKKEGNDILKSVVEIHRLENEGDGLLRAGLAKLFKERHDPLYVMKWKEILESVEYAIDVCEDIGDVLNGIVLENQ